MKRIIGHLSVLTVLFALIAAPALTGAAVRAQDSSPTGSPISCDVAPKDAPSVAPTVTPGAAGTATGGELGSIKVGFVPVTVFAPVFVAEELGYYAEEGLDVQLEPFPGGADPVVLTASGELDAAFVGVGPAFWNGAAQDLGIKLIAPGHAEGNPVATPLMISKKSCEDGTITSVAELEGKKVSVNARGATEYWLNAALSTGGLTINDIQLEVLPFPDAVAALESGAVDAAMVGEPLATQAELDGIAVRLSGDFPVQDVQPTAIVGNESWLAEHPDQAEAFVTGYMRASKLLANGGLDDPAVQAIIQEYTGVPAELVASAVQPVFSADGFIAFEGLAKLQTFFREREQLEYETDLDPYSLADETFVMSAMAELNPNSP
ncbi:MAG: ABC transporter substrate-binding protein [Thermomicrobiales bacterium]|nr:ABC transporter substrate-binding protein [Thermomicrobiales bacterium]MCO5222842.1 ABC transporter substrate-binding protein [Thermomicrobiales bacterium]